MDLYQVAKLGGRVCQWFGHNLFKQILTNTELKSVYRISLLKGQPREAVDLARLSANPLPAIPL